MEEIFEEIMERNFPQMTLFEMTYKGPNKRDKAYQYLGITIKFENNQDKEKILSFQRERTDHLQRNDNEQTSNSYTGC